MHTHRAGEHSAPQVPGWSPAPGRVLLALASVAILLLLAFGATQYYRYKIAPALLHEARASNPQTVQTDSILNPRGIVRQFDLDAEANLPTVWSSAQLAAASVLLGVIWRDRRRQNLRFARGWAILATGFAFLSIDEIVSVHSHLYIPADSEGVRKARGLFYYSWVVPALALVSVLGVFYSRFVWALPGRTRLLFALSATGYVGAAIGGEMISGLLIAEGAAATRTIKLSVIAIEEIGEMLSIGVFIVALLDYMRKESIALTVGYAPAMARFIDDEPATTRLSFPTQPGSARRAA